MKLTHVEKVNSYMLAWTENKVRMTKKFNTEDELYKFRKDEIEPNKKLKILGMSIDVEFEKGYDCYEDLSLN
ncbi:hypothetical protein [Clostridium sp.]|uniref:hypothetical protein n=1 Tax=Clostridium sp. TaxID=1506 RepID=UPI001A49926B|nr:hypothetical protein [Clostridium sp.]MBK5243361.1 hypothetical protein [Clostridium sp.]